MAIDTSTNSASSIMQSLQVGSGIDIRSLAKGLSEAENQGKIDAVSKKKDAVEASISGYGILASSIDALKFTIEKIKDKDSLKSSTVLSSSSELQVTTTGGALRAADHEIRVEQLAKAQVSILPLNSEQDPGNISTLSVGGQDFSPAAGATSSDVVAAINNADIGVTATLVNRKSEADTDGDGDLELIDDWVILLRGQPGSTNAFDVELNGTSSAAAQDASDARIGFDGVTVYRSTNVVTDLVSGVSLDLRNTVIGTSYQVSTRSDFVPLKDSLKELLAQYNDMEIVLNELVNPDSDLVEYSGSLARDKALVTSVRNELRTMFGQVSATATGQVDTLRDLGFSFGLDGTLTLDEDALDAALVSEGDAVVSMLTAGVNGQTRYAPASVRGLGLELSLKLDSLIASGGVIQPRVATASGKVADYDKQLAALELRLQSAYERYVQQFAAMESFVQKSKDIGNYLEGQFKAMQNSNGD